MTRTKNYNLLYILTLVFLLVALPLTLQSCNSSRVDHADEERTVGQMTDDSAISAKINARYMKDSRVSAMDIDVDTYNGVVTLKGNVPSYESKKRAISIAKRVEGVREVRSELNVIPPAGK